MQLPKNYALLDIWQIIALLIISKRKIEAHWYCFVLPTQKGFFAILLSFEDIQYVIIGKKAQKNHIVPWWEKLWGGKM